MLLRELIVWADLVGVVVFAITGGLTASRRQLDLVGFVLVATVTGIGGGTFRDVLLDRPVFWLGAPHYLYLTAASGILVYFAAPQIAYRYPVLLWFDALGLALFCVMGAEIALAHGAGPTIAVLMGVMTASVGGIVRDVLCGEPSLILRPEIYLTAALAGAAGYVALAEVGVVPWLAGLLGFTAALATRGAALAFGLKLPVHRHRPGRDYPLR
jgi:uncharacterized membrane protein YeiH